MVLNIKLDGKIYVTIVDVEGVQLILDGKIKIYFEGEWGWGNIVTWDKGCYLPYALVFAIKIERMAMEGVKGCD